MSVGVERRYPPKHLAHALQSQPACSLLINTRLESVSDARLRGARARAAVVIRVEHARVGRSAASRRLQREQHGTYDAPALGGLGGGPKSGTTRSRSKDLRSEGWLGRAHRSAPARKRSGRSTYTALRTMWPGKVSGNSSHCEPTSTAIASRAGPHGRASRGGAPADLREARVGPFERVQVDWVVQVERRIREPDHPPARRGAPRP